MKVISLTFKSLFKSKVIFQLTYDHNFDWELNSGK